MSGKPPNAPAPQKQQQQQQQQQQLQLQRKNDRQSETARTSPRSPATAGTVRPLLPLRNLQSSGARPHVQSPLSQQPANMSPGRPSDSSSVTVERPAPTATPPTTYPGSIHRANVPHLRSSPSVSPGHEPETAGTISPSLAQAFDSPSSTGAPTALPTSDSNASTESARTVRGGGGTGAALGGGIGAAGAAGATGAGITATGFSLRTAAASNIANTPLRTPSYPFPYVMPAGPTRRYSGPMHQPFMTLSPTVAGPERDLEYPGSRDRFHSISSTPGASVHNFQPSGAATPVDEPDDRFPSPNLYDLVLELNAEPSLDDWWTSVINIMHNWYTVDRATLSLPADPTDIENVPWGLKAVYNTNGIRMRPDSSTSTQRSSSIDSGASRVSSKKGSSTGTRPDRTAINTSPTTQRPSAESRASFTLQDIRESDTSPQRTQTQTQVPSQAQSQASRPATRAENADRASTAGSFYQLPNPSSVGEFTVSEAPQEEPFSALFPTLQPLDYEVEAILDTTSVNRILERNKPVILTREYTGHSQQQEQCQQPAKTEPKSSSERFGAAHADGKMATLYEEYEQHPVSPWSQSPAPSPAIQADPDENPFFSASQVEESFSPGSTMDQDYARCGAVEAIGVERAATIIHLPLVHPLHSWKLLSLDQDEQQQQQRQNTDDDDGLKLKRTRSKKKSRRAASATPAERRAPVAILSLYSRTVPFPQSLESSLRHFCPHMATSLHTSLQMNVMQQQMLAQQSSGLARPWDRLGGGVGGANTTGGGGGVTGLGLGIDNNTAASSSTIGSIASPSEWSSRSTSSVLGTPGLDISGLPGPGRHSRAATPGTAPIVETTDNYFDAKKRIPISRSQSTNVVPLSHTKSPGKLSVDRSSHEARGGRPRERRRTADVQERAVEPLKPSAARRDEQDVSPESLRHAEHTKRRSLLHSYGADFSASFGALPAATGLHQELSTSSAAEAAAAASATSDMPPPSERLIRTIVDALPVQIFTAQPQTGALTWANTKFLVYRGHGARQVVDEPWAAIHDHDQAGYIDGWKRSLESGHQFQRKVRIRRWDGVYRWFYVRAAPLRDRTQSIVHWVGTYVDVHEQHIAESNSARQQETAASENKYRALANSSPQIVFAATRARGIVFCNTQWIDYSGQPEEQALGVGFLQHVHPDDVVKCKLPSFDDADDGRPNVPVSMPAHPPPHRTTSGVSSSATATSTPGLASPGDASRSVSEDSASTTVTVTGYNAASPSEMPQRKLSELASRGILKVTRDSTGKPSYSTEVRLRNRLGEFRWHLVRVLLAETSISEDQEEETWYGSCADINDHKELESQLKETMDAKSRFLSNMSHEIRTPLNGIHGMANFLIDSKLSEDQMDQVNVIRTSAEGLRDLINDILDLSKVEAGMITLERNWLHLRSIIEEVNDLAAPLALDKNIELNYLVEDSVPTVVRGDRFRIRQVLLNVIGNAIKFTQRGEVLVRCARIPAPASLPADAALVQFEVHDTGKGFTEKEAERLFKRFSQIDASSTRQHGGTGLGLVISMQLVELHGGTMSAKSIPGQGSTFSFSLELTLAPAGGQSVSDAGQADAAEGGGGLENIRTSPLALADEPPILGEDAAAGLTTPRELQSLPSPRIVAPESPVSPMKSSGSSDPSVRSALASSRSARSSQSSHASSFTAVKTAGISLDPPPVLKTPEPPSLEAIRTPAHRLSGARVRPLLYSVLVIATLPWTREATSCHLHNILPKNVPHHVKVCSTMDEARALLAPPRDANVIFTHIVINMAGSSDTVSLLQLTLSSSSLALASIVIVTSLGQRKEIRASTPDVDYDQLTHDGRLHFVFKPLKAAKLSPIFDPEKSRKRSTDHNQHSAQQVAENQKHVFDEMTRRLGNRNHRVLIVEDNLVNQKVLSKLLKRVSLASETANDGVECLERFFSRPAGYYSIILCDLHMPNKDGYQTCSEIRTWERKEKKLGRPVRRVPIVALSANVLGDVQADCAKAGFDDFLTKPVEFKDFSNIVTRLLDPENS